jgi:hypothetical protein
MYNNINTSSYENGQNNVIRNPYASKHHSAPAKRQGGLAPASSIPPNFGLTPRMTNNNVRTNQSPNSDTSASKPTLLFQGDAVSRLLYFVVSIFIISIINYLRNSQVQRAAQDKASKTSETGPSETTLLFEGDAVSPLFDILFH